MVCGVVICMVLFYTRQSFLCASLSRPLWFPVEDILPSRRFEYRKVITEPLQKERLVISCNSLQEKIGSISPCFCLRRLLVCGMACELRGTSRRVSGDFSCGASLDEFSAGWAELRNMLAKLIWPVSFGQANFPDTEKIALLVILFRRIRTQTTAKESAALKPVRNHFFFSVHCFLGITTNS